MRKRDCSFLVRMSGEEFSDLEDQVNNSGLTREDYVRKVLSGDGIHRKPEVKKNAEA